MYIQALVRIDHGGDGARACSRCRAGTAASSLPTLAAGQALRARGGFTIVELAVVLALLGILIGIGRPYIDFSRFEIEAGVQRVGTTLLAAQRLAVKKQHNIVVAIDAANGVLRLHEDANNDGVMDNGEAVRNVEIGERITFGRAGAPARAIGADDITFTRTQSGLPAVTFHRNGSTSEEGGFYLTTRRAIATGVHATDTYAVEVERSTGRATWFHYDSQEWRRGF